MVALGVSLAALLARVALGEDAATKPAVSIPPAAARPVDFVNDVVPILQQSCVSCHTSGKAEADFSLETREKILEGGGSGSPAITPGNSGDSQLIQLVSGADPDPDRFMPKKGKKLTPQQIGILRAWIDQGANWPKDYVLHDASRPIPAKLEPREVAIPAAHDGIDNPIDLLLEPYFKEHHVTPAKSIDDRAFARRIYLDLVGLLPPTEELDKFIAESSPAKRLDLVRKLLDDKPRYAVHWLSFWNDMLRNDYKGTGYIDGGRLPITPWLYHALLDNMPYDRFVRELVTGANGSEGFTKGIVWRGVVNAAQTPQMQAAQNIGQVFMGVNLKCASCHDSFVSQWKLSDSYGLAGVYADKPLEMERCSKPLGQTASMKFLYPQLGSIDEKLPRAKRLDQLAQIITNERNGRLSRTIVNRLWQRLMGRGIIEPTDEMDNPPWNADLLDALAWKFSHDDGFDIKKAIERIVLSRAYQTQAAPISENAKDFVFAGPCFKKMTAEQFADGISTLTGIWPEKQDATLSAAAMAFKNARWIWSDKRAATTAPVGKSYFRRTIEITQPLERASAVIAADNAFELFVNGKKVASGDDWGKPVRANLMPQLHVGTNVLAIAAENTGDQPNPAGLLLRADFAYRRPISGKPMRTLATDAKWRAFTPAATATTQAATQATKKTATTKAATTKLATTRAAATQPADWASATFNDKSWPAAVVLGDLSIGPWSLAEKVSGVADDNGVEQSAQIRAALCAANPLTTALGRPNREQVNTVRPSASTTLMALELTNGATLTDTLTKGARKLATEPDLRAEELIDRVYEMALSRPPTDDEVATAKQIVGAELKEDGVEDFLWAVVMLPEFQIIR